MQCEEYELSSNRPAFPAAARAAIGGVPGTAFEKFPLTWIWIPL